MKIKHLLVLFLVLSIGSCTKSKTDQIESSEIKNTETENVDTISDDKTIDIEETGKYAILNDSRVRLRNEPYLSSDTIKLLNKNERVIVNKKTFETEKIQNMNSPWYEITVNDNVVGWIYGYFLDLQFDETIIPVVSMYSNDLSRIIGKDVINSIDNSLYLSVKRINLSQEPIIPKVLEGNDLIAYNMLAGIYIMDEPVIPPNRDTLYETKTTWGNDFSFGRGTYKIDFTNNEWVFSGDGDARNFSISKINENKITIDLGPKSTPRERQIKVSDDSIFIWDTKYYKVSGPKNYLNYIKLLSNSIAVENTKYSLEKPSVISRKLGDKPIEIYNLLKDNDNEKLLKYCSNSNGLKIEFNPRIKLSNAQLSIDDKKYIDSITAISDDLNNKYAPDYNQAIVFYNEYIVNSILERQEEFPGSIVVEVFINTSTYLTMIFIEENNEYKIICIENHTLDFA